MGFLKGRAGLRLAGVTPVCLQGPHPAAKAQHSAKLLSWSCHASGALMLLSKQMSTSGLFLDFFFFFLGLKGSLLGYSVFLYLRCLPKICCSKLLFIFAVLLHDATAESNYLHVNVGWFINAVFSTFSMSQRSN